MNDFSAPYCCPFCKSELTVTVEKKLVCSCARTFDFDEETNIVFFEKQEKNKNEYSIEKAAEVHDNALSWLLEAHNTTEDKFRQDILDVLRLEYGQKCLITGVGAGNDLPYICEKLGNDGVIFAQDIAEEMLFAAKHRVDEKFGLNDFHIHFCLSDAVNLPYQDNFFDVVYHFGGINLFSDIRKGIFEMDRVVKNGGRVVFGDEGLADWLVDTEFGKMLIKNNPLYKHKIPLEFLPPTARNVQINWTINNCYYLVSFDSYASQLPLNIDLPHEGKRGGSIRTRFYGNLEGVDPELKEEIYKKAAQKGESRVEFLEKIIRSGLRGI